MIFKPPATSQELWDQLEQAISAMPKRDQQVFLLDLMKYVVEWQFAYMAYEQQQNMAEGPQEPLKRI